MKTAFILFSALAVSAFANAQDIPLNSLRIGDDAPAFKPTSAAKGECITSFQKGKTYVLEFWATWCGPCIAAMPHFSDLADKYKGRAEFYSVNTMNYVEKGVFESLDEHTKKINDWVTKNTDKMRYNSVLDDKYDTIYKSWVTAIGEAGVPVSLIVDDEGKIAWVGHPADVDKPLTAVLDKTWDIKAFRDDYEKRNEPAREVSLVRPKIEDYIASENLEKLEALINSAKHKANVCYTSFALSMMSAPNFGAKLVKKYDVNDGMSLNSWYSICNRFLPRVTDPNSKSDIVKVSENKANQVKPSKAAEGYAYHAMLLTTAGDKVGAKQWLEKARKALDQYEPVGKRGDIRELIDDVANILDK